MDELDRDVLVKDLGMELDRSLERHRRHTWMRIITLIAVVVGIVLVVGMLWDGESTYQTRDDSYDRDTLMVEPEVFEVEVDGRDVTCISRTGLFEASLSCDWESAGDPEPEPGSDAEPDSDPDSEPGSGADGADGEAGDEG